MIIVRAVLILFILQISMNVTAQNRVRGILMSAVDSSALTGATVMSLDGVYNTQCDTTGLFILEDFPSSVDSIHISYLGFQTQIMALRGVADIGTLLLKQNENSIDAVVVRSEAPMVVQKGGLIQFNAAAFKVQPDVDVDHLMEKVPGVVIQDGKIEAQGEPVRKIYVDGKLFFGTDPMDALTNLPADAVESIQLFDEPSEMARYSGVEDGETQKVINIVTKAKTREVSILKTEGSYGADVDDHTSKRYMVGGSFSKFTETNRITVMALGNNINTRKYTGSLDDDTANSPKGVSEVWGGGINYSLDKDKIEITSSYSVYRTNEVLKAKSTTDFFGVESKFDQKSTTKETSGDDINLNHAGRLRLEWRPNDKNTIIFSPRFKIVDMDLYDDVYSMTTQDNDPLNRTKTLYNNDVAINELFGEMLWVRRFEKKGRSLSIAVDYQNDAKITDKYQEEEYRQTYAENGNGDENDPFWKSQNETNRYFDESYSLEGFGARVRYTEPFAKYHKIIVTGEWSNDKATSIRQALDWSDKDDDYTDKQEKQSSDFDRDYSVLGAGIGYGLYLNGFNLNTTISYQQLEQNRYEKEPTKVNTNLEFNTLKPSVVFKYSLKKRKYLKFTYTGRSLIPRIEQMGTYINDMSHMNVRIGNPDLEQGYENKITLFYNSSNVEKSTYLTLMARASAQSNYTAMSTTIVDEDTDIEGYDDPMMGAQLSRAINLDGYINVFTQATYGFKFKPIKSNVNVTLGYGLIRIPSEYMVLNFADTHSANLRIGITSNVSENVDFNLYSTTSIKHTINSTRENSTYLNQNVHYAVNLIFWRSFVLNSVFSWKHYQSLGFTESNTNFYLWNIGLGKKIFKNKKAEIRLTVYDVLNQNKNLQQFARATSVEETESNSLGQYAMLRLSYRFNSMSQNRAPKREK